MWKNVFQQHSFCTKFTSGAIHCLEVRKLSLISSTLEGYISLDMHLSHEYIIFQTILIFQCTITSRKFGTHFRLTMNNIFLWLHIFQRYSVSSKAFYLLQEATLYFILKQLECVENQNHFRIDVILVFEKHRMTNSSWIYLYDKQKALPSLANEFISHAV